MTRDDSKLLSRDILDDTTREALDILPLGVCALEENLRVVAWNHTLADWTGITKHDAMGANLGRLFPEVLSSRLHDRLLQVFQTGCPAVFSAALHDHFIPIRRVGADDSGLMVQQTEVRRLSRTPPRVLITIQDVSELAIHIRTLQDKQRSLIAAQAAAEEASRLKTAFLANMSHEIRTPLSAILGYADLLLQSRDFAGDELSSLKTIKRSGDHLMSIIDDILDISKIEAGRIDVERVPMSVCEVVEEVVYLMRPRATEKDISLESDFRCPLPTSIASDPTRFRQILVNLVGNAIKFTEEGGVRITVSMDRSEGGPYVRVGVKDTGIGMNSHQVARVFKPFVQADATTTRKYGGTGLGLTICKRLSAILGGGISVESLPGRGSKFTLRIPVGASFDSDLFESESDIRDAIQAQVCSHASNSDPLDATMVGALEGVRVLVAEDSPDIVRLLTFHLEKAGAEVSIAENGRVALEKIEWAGRGRRVSDEDEQFHIILMDMQMPVMDGYRATREIRTRGFGIPIIALTAHAMAGDRQRCLDAGCDEYARKPIDRETLIRICAAFSARDQSANAA